MSFPAYEEYKDSGIDWLGEVPKHWEVSRLGHFATIENGSTPSRNNLDYWDDGTIPWVSSGEVNQYHITEPSELITQAALDECPIRVLPVGSIVIGMIGQGKTRGLAAILKIEVTINQNLAAIVTGEKLDTVYLHYTFQSVYVFLREFGRGGQQAALNCEILGATQIPVPPGPEQTAIASFLDTETSKIDLLVSEQRRLIELLKEKRQAVISHAVTKGLDPSVPMKDSGIQWLGEVPEHWEVKPLKYLTPQITVGIVVEPSKHYVDEGIPALRSLNVDQGTINQENPVYISDEANELHAKSKIYAGDLVAVRSGQTGTTAVVPESLDGCNCIDLIIIRKPADGSEWFLSWFLASDAAVAQFSLGSGGAIQQHFNIGTAMHLLVTTPPPAEQIEIVSQVCEETTQIDTLVAQAERAIELLQERRTALISAAVTGKIDVREFVTETVA
jgi:type I restriction enzyme S subunit